MGKGGGAEGFRWEGTGRNGSIVTAGSPMQSGPVERFVKKRIFSVSNKNGRSEFSSIANFMRHHSSTERISGLAIEVTTMIFHLKLNR